MADSNMRLYLGVLRAAQEQARRGRPDVAFQIVQRRWTSWRGRAVEPVVRQSLELVCAAGDLPWPETQVVGGWWNRQFDPEIDLVGADRAPVAQQVDFVGSVKWLGAPFDGRDLAELARDAVRVPGFTLGRSALVIVSLSGAAADLNLAEIDRIWGPGDVLSAWRPAG